MSNPADDTPPGPLSPDPHDLDQAPGPADPPTTDPTTEPAAGTEPEPGDAPPTDDGPPTPPEPPAGEPARPKALLLAGAGAVVLAVVVAGAFLLFGDDDDDAAEPRPTSESEETEDGNVGPDDAAEPDGPDPGKGDDEPETDPPASTETTSPPETSPPTTAPGSASDPATTESPEDPFHLVYDAFAAGDCATATDQFSAAALTEGGGRAAVEADCQDAFDAGRPGDITRIDTRVASREGDRATVEVTTVTGGESYTDEVRVVFENGGWRINEY